MVDHDHHQENHHHDHDHDYNEVVDDDGEEQWLTPERRIKPMHTTSVQVKSSSSLIDLRIIIRVIRTVVISVI